jgi:hypothetical protein
MSTTASRLATTPAPVHVSLAAVVLRWCTTCATETTFKQPVCDDHRGADCPEWSCVECGEGLLLGFDLPEVARPGAAHRVG